MNHIFTYDSIVGILAVGIGLFVVMNVGNDVGLIVGVSVEIALDYLLDS